MIKPGMLVAVMCLCVTMASCWTTENADGSRDTSVLGIPVSHTEPDGSFSLSPFAEGLLPGWVKVGAAVVAAWKGAEAVGTKRGRRNLGTLVTPGKNGKLKAARALTLGTDSPDITIVH